MASKETIGALINGRWECKHCPASHPDIDGFLNHLVYAHDVDPAATYIENGSVVATDIGGF